MHLFLHYSVFFKIKFVFLFNQKTVEQKSPPSEHSNVSNVD